MIFFDTVGIVAGAMCGVALGWAIITAALPPYSKLMLCWQRYWELD